MAEFFESLGLSLGLGLGTASAVVLRAVVVFLICFIAIRVLRTLIKKLLSRSRLDATLRGFVCTASNVLLWVLAVIIVASTLGIDTASLVAVVSVVGLALSLALQNIMGNIFSGVTLLFTHPFKAGDYVLVAGNEGTVESVGLFYTVIKTADNKAVNIPNGDVTSSSVINYSSDPLRRVDLSFGVSFECGAEAVRAALLEAASSDARVLVEPPPFVGVSEYGESSVRYILRVWCHNEDYWGVYFALNERVRACFDAHGVRMSYSHLNVHMVRED